MSHHYRYRHSRALVALILLIVDLYNQGSVSPTVELSVISVLNGCAAAVLGYPPHNVVLTQCHQLTPVALCPST